MIHNEVASAANLARQTLMFMDRSKDTVTLPVATLELLLRTLIELADANNPTAIRTSAAAGAFVSGHTTGVESW